MDIKNLKDFNEFAHIIKLASIIINDAVEENDMELIYEAFYQIESRFKKENLINNFFNFDNNIEYNNFIDVNYDIKEEFKTVTTIMELNSNEF